MNLGTVLEYTLASFIGFMLQSIGYGIYFVIFAAFVRIRLKRTDKGSKLLLCLVTVNFIACTAFLAFCAVVISQSNQNGNLGVVPDALYTCVDFISQVILIYRCSIMWRHQPWVMVVPILLTLAFLVISLTTLAKIPSFLEFASRTGQAPDWYFATVLSFFSVSLAVNALVTGLIIYRILTIYRGIQSRVGRLERDIAPTIHILIESGVITFVAQLVQTLMFAFANNAYPMIVGFVVMIYGVSTAIVLVFVEMGLNYEADNESSKSTLRFAASECSNDVQVTTTIA